MNRWALLVLLVIAAGRLEAGDSLVSVIPAACGFWSPTDSLRLFPGEKLYELIDGGAEIFLEYGFVRAGSRHYSTSENGELGVEVHEMRDTVAAWGIFSFLAAGTGVPAAFGQDGVQGDDFVIFWKNRYVVLVTAINEKGRSGIRGMAGTIDQLIRAAGRRPDLAEALLHPEFRNSDVLLMKGALAFDRRSEFGLGNVFRLREGVSGLFDSCRTFILRYGGAKQSRSAAAEGIRLLTEKGGFRDISVGEEARLLSGERGRLVAVARHRRYLMLTIGESRKKVETTAAGLARAVARLRL